MLFKQNKNGMTPLTIKYAKITIVLIFFCFAECAAGNCLNYGHACWGAHGKRSGNQQDGMKDDTSSKGIIVPRWFLTKLLKAPLDLKYAQINDQNPAFNTRPEKPLFANDVDLSNIKGLEDYDPEEFLAEETQDELFPKFDFPKKIHSPKIILKKRAVRSE